MAVGDVNLAWRVGERIEQDGPGFVFARVAGLFAPADVVMANLECTLSDLGKPWPGKEEHFAAPDGAVRALVAGGIDIVSLANNHAMDFDREGLLETMALLDAAGVEHFGAGLNRDDAHAPLVIERNGVRVALLSFVLPFSAKAGFNTRAWQATPGQPGVAVAHPSQVGPAVTAARELADVVVVVVHSGGEYRHQPKPNQVAAAKAALQAGAVLVVGHGPHNLQGYVRDGNTLVAYSVGNFVFDDYTGPQNDSAILDVTLSAEGVTRVNWIPVEIEDGLPRPATAEEAARIMSQLARTPLLHEIPE